MNEQVIQDLYNRAVSNGYKKSQGDFVNLIHTNQDVFNDMYSYVQSKGYQKSSEDFEVLIGKKKREAVPPAEKTSQPSAGMVSPSGVGSSEQSTTPSQRPTEEFKGFTPEMLANMGGAPGVSQSQQEAQSRLQFERKAAEGRKEDRAQRLAEVASMQGYKEQPYFTGDFGKAINNLPFGIGDFIDDTGRALGQGATQGEITAPANRLMLSGPNSSPEQIKKFVETSKALENYGPSDEMVAFTKAVEEDNGGVLGFIKGIVQNPGVLPEVMISSFRALVNPASAAAAGTVVGGAAAGGAITGGGVGAAPAALASIPYAMAAAGTTLETGLSFAEFMKEELDKKGLEFNEQNVKAVLEDEDALSKIRTRAVSRGVTIGVIDAFTGRVAGKVGAKMATRPGAGTVMGKIKGGLAGAGIESVGGSLGEATARGIAGQEMDIAEIGLEGIGEAPMAAIDIAAEVLNRPRYKVNGEVTDEQSVREIIRTATPEELTKINFNFSNDKSGLGEQINEIIQTDKVRQEVKSANPEMDDAMLEAIVPLERELGKLQGNNTQTGKDKANQLRQRIRDIQDGKIPVETVTPTAEPTAPTEATPTAAPTMTFNEVQPNVGVELGEELRREKKNLTAFLQADEEFYNEQKAKYEQKNVVGRAIDRLLGTAPSYDYYVGENKRRLQLLESDPVKYFEERLANEQEYAKEYRAIADKTGDPKDIEEADYFENSRVPRAQETLDNLKTQINAIQKPSTEEGVLRREGPTMELPKVGEGDQGQEVAQAPVPTQEGVVSSRTLEEEVSMLEDMLTEDEQVDVVNEFGEPVDTVDDAKAALSRGDFVYVIDEMTETPTLVSDVTILDNYTPENIAVVSRTNMPGAQQQVQPTGAPQLLGVEVGPGSVMVSDAQAVADLRSRTTDARKSSVLSMAEKAVKTLKSIFPDMDIVLHENKQSYVSTMSRFGKDGNQSRGSFSYLEGADGKIAGGRIDIDLSSADAVTVAHEVAHAVMMKAFGNNPALFEDFRDRISKVLSESTVDALNDFASNYSKEESHEEFLVELAGLMSEQGKKIPDNIIRKIAAIINDVVSKITNGAVVPFEEDAKLQDVVDFLNTMSSAISEGREIDINSLGLSGQIVSEGVKSKASIVSGEIKRFPVNENTKVIYNTPLSRFNGKKTGLMESDRMTGGFIADSEGEPMYKFFGGVYFPIITGKWWASRKNATARNIAKVANNSRDKDGYAYSTPMVGSAKQHMSNEDMMFATIELMKNDVSTKKSGVKKDELIEYVKKAFSLTGLKNRKKNLIVKDVLKKTNTINSIFNELEFFIFQKGDYIVDRNGDNILDDNNKPIKVFTFEERNAIVKSILGDPKQKEVRFPSAGSITSVAKRFEEPLTEKVSSIGDMVVVYRTKGTLKHRKTKESDPFYHRSYPYEIYAVDENGNPAEVEVFVLDKAYSMREAIPEIERLSGGKFSWDEYVKKSEERKKQGKKYNAISQYARTAKISYGLGDIKAPTQELVEQFDKASEKAKPKIKSKAQVAVHKDTGFVPVSFWVEQLRDKTKYLDDVIKSILDAREELKQGKVKDRKVAKSYLITLASMGSGGGYLSKWIDKTGQKISGLFTEKTRGKDWIRPEGAAAAYLVTPEGEKLTDDIINGTATEEQIKKLFLYVGVGRENKKTEYVLKSMKNDGIKKMTNMFNENKGSDFNALYQGAIKNLSGIAEGKTGFFNQYFGVAERGVVDARQLNAWIAGQMKLTDEQKAKKKKVAASKKLGDQLLGYIEQVGIELGYPKDLAGYIAHHAIWDAIANSVTTHEGEYKVVSKAQKITIEPIDFENESENIDVYEAENTANKIAKSNGVNILRGKELRSVALDENGNVIGGLWTEVDNNEFSFDIAVDKPSQGSGVGERLLKEAFTEFNFSNYENNLNYKVDVTNPIMEKLLSKYGFNVVEKYGAHTIMAHPTNSPIKAVVSKAQVKEGQGDGKYRVNISFYGRGGRSSYAKVYEFNDEQHYKNWRKKFGDKLPIDEVYILNSKAQLSKLRGIQKVVELGRASGFSEDAIATVLQKKGYSQAEIDEAMKGKKAAPTVVVEETFAEGYDRMMGEVDGIIEKGLNRGSSQEQILDNVINYIQGSKVYENATDIQREKLIRDARAAFGKKEKAAPKVERILGTLKDVKKVTMSEYALLKKQIKDYAKGAKEATTAWRRASQAITADLRELVKAGKITTKQAVAVLRRFSKVNMFDPNSIESFVNYMTRVFENADYAERISNLRKKLKLAKDSASRKIGIADRLYPMLSRMLSIDPTLIPDAVLDDYANVVEMLGKRDAVIKLAEIGEVTDKVRGVLDAVDEELSTLETLIELFEQYPDKVFDKDGALQFAETVDAMVEDGTITDADAKIMRKYRSKVMPKVERAKKSEQEIADEKKELLKAVASTDVNPDTLPTQDERNLARELQKLKNTDAVNELSNSELEKLLLVIDNINNGYLPHYAQLMKERLNSINNAKPLENSVRKAKPLPISSLYSRLKSILMKNSNAMEVMVQRTPLFYIDQVFGDFKTKDIFDSVLKQISQAMSVFNTAIQRVEDKLNNALEQVAKSHGNDPNKTRMSSYKMMAYMLQLEFQSNPDSKQVHPAADFLKATIKHIRDGKTNLSEADADMLQEILNKFSTDGNVDADKLFKSFNGAEKDALDTIKGINVDMRDKAVFTSQIIRGDKMTPLNNYVHHNVLHDNKPSDSISGVTSAEEFNNMMQPSTRGKSLISRTKGVKPLDFNIFSATQRGANYVLMDYHLTEPIRTARKTINEADAMLEKDGMTKQERDVLKAIRNSFESAVRNTLVARFHNNTFADEVVNFITKQGYRSVLASTTRWVAELTSNMGFILFADRKSWLNGVKNYSDITMSPSSIDVLTNLKSTQSARLYPSDTLSGRLVDTSIMNQASGMKGGRAKGAFANATQRIYNNTLKKYKNFVETTADTLISTPDKIMMRPYWFGSFATEFKNLTGAEPDFDKIAANDEAYMTENADALEQATKTADEKSVLAGASDNPFMGILKGQITPDMNAFLKAFNTFNNYMTRFLIYEYSTARTGIMAAMGNGSINKKQGAALLGGVATRMVVYSLLTSTLGNALVGLFVDDEDEDEEKDILQKVGQSMASGMTALLLGRDFGNATRTVVNYGVEKMNEEFLTGLRNGEYDPYKDAIAYSAFQGQSDKATLQDYLINMAGPLTPVAKTTALIVKKATEGPKKEAAAIARGEKEKNVRIPLEILGNAGLVPLYKDVRKVVLADIYKGMKKEMEGDKKSEFMGLKKDELKKYFPEMYKEKYGEGTLNYELEQLNEKYKSEMNDLNKRMKDEMYNYTPKKSDKEKKKGEKYPWQE